MTDERKQRRSIPSLDGLRGIAVGLVVLAHLGMVNFAASKFAGSRFMFIGKLFEVDAGDLGVSIFFVISGYLITTLLLRHVDSQGRASLTGFYARRFFRIFPPYYCYLLVVAILSSSRLVPMVRGGWISSMLYVSNYYPYRLSKPSTEGWLVGHTWSLSLEEQFYLVWPACLHWLGRRRSAWLGCALLVLSPLSRLLTIYLVPASTLLGQIDRMFHTRLDTIMAGCVLALIDVWPEAHSILTTGVRRKLSGMVALVLLFAVLHASWQSFRFMQVFGIGLESVLLAYLVFYSIQNANTRGGNLLNQAWLRHVGVISYGLYLWQQLWVGPVQIGGKHHLWTRLFLVLASAELSYFLVERPSFQVRDWYIGRKSLSAPSSAAR